jgi:hypothetical protein
MTIVKKIKLNLIERRLESIVLQSSKIKSSQEELSCLEERINDIRSEFETGNLSESIYNTNKKSSEREKKLLASRISIDIKKTIKKIDEIEKVLKEVDI